jgi:hypothetical protein
MMNDALFEAMLRVGAQHPILRPLPAIDVPLRIVIPDRLFLWYVITVPSHSRSLRGR